MRSSNHSAVSPNYPADRNRKAPVTRDRDVSLSVGQPNGSVSRGSRRRSSVADSTFGNGPSVANPASVARGDGLYHVDEHGSAYMPVSHPRSMGRRSSLGVNSMSPSRRDSKAPFVVEKPPKPPLPAKRDKVDANYIEMRWRGTLRAGDLEKEDDLSTALVPFSDPNAPNMEEVYNMQQYRRDSVTFPTSMLEKEIPYDYIRVARTERAFARNGGPPIVYAVRKNKYAHDAGESIPRSHGGIGEVDEYGQPIVGSASRSRRRPDGGLYEDTYEHDDGANSDDEARSLVSQMSQATAEARKVAYDRWRDRTAIGLYKDIFVPPSQCEMREVPPFFEPALTAEEIALVKDCQYDELVLNGYKERVLRYRLATQENAKLSSMEDVQLTHADAATLLPLVRAIRYHHEEENWRSIVEAIKRNKELIEERSAAEKQQEADYQESLALYYQQRRDYQTQMRNAAHGGNEDERWSNTEAMGGSRRTSVPSNPGMGNAAINSATTPGWMRHREFSGTEWDQLRGKKEGAGASAQDNASAAPEVTAPRNPNVPAWMHHLTAAQAAEEANDPQQQKLNEIESASTVQRQRRSSVGYSIGQSQRMRASTDVNSEESLSFARSEEVSSVQYSVARPTRVDVTAAHENVVDNQVTPPPEVVPPRLIASAERDSRSPPVEMPLVTAVAPVPPPLPEPLPPLELQSIVFIIYPFSTFEATQELKRITWWCAARAMDAFTVLVGEVEGYAGPRRAGHGSQPRSYSPTFFPSISRFYDETLMTVTKDLWLRKRVTVAAHDSDSGEIDFEITSATIREAAEQNWLMKPGVPLPSEDDDAKLDDDYPSAREPQGTARPNELQLRTLPALGGTSAPSKPEVDFQVLRFFTDTPHPKASKVQLF